MTVKQKYKVGDKVKFNMDIVSELYGYEGVITRVYQEGEEITCYVKFELEYDLPQEYIIRKLRSK